jgi:hypothetical protein
MIEEDTRTKAEKDSGENTPVSPVAMVRHTPAIEAAIWEQRSPNSKVVVDSESRDVNGTLPAGWRE